SNVNFTLGVAGAISGTVKQLSDGTPVGSVLVSATSGTSAYNALTAANGTYSIVGVPPGNYTVTIKNDALMTVSASANVTANTTTSLSLAVVARGSVSGTVTNSVNSSPIANVTVHAVASDGSVTSAVSDATGKYKLTGLDADTYL